MFRTKLKHKRSFSQDLALHLFTPPKWLTFGFVSQSEGNYPDLGDKDLARSGKEVHSFLMEKKMQQSLEGEISFSAFNVRQVRREHKQSDWNCTAPNKLHWWSFCGIYVLTPKTTTKTNNNGPSELSRDAESCQKAPVPSGPNSCPQSEFKRLGLVLQTKACQTQPHEANAHSPVGPSKQGFFPQLIKAHSTSSGRPFDSCSLVFFFFFLVALSTSLEPKGYQFYHHKMAMAPAQGTPYN